MNSVPATFDDYQTCCKLVQTSDQLDMNGWLMVQPTDLPPETAHLDMLLANMVLCDKAYVGAAMTRQAALDCLEMAAIVWGGKENLARQPVMTTIVNATSPLQYPADEADAIIAMAGCGQLCSYISMSFEKWLIDEEVCRTLRRVLTGMQISIESIDIETIRTVGIDGNYLLHPTTFKHCRTLYQPKIFTRSDYATWVSKGAARADEQAAQHLAERPSQYTKPAIDEGLEQALQEFIAGRHNEYGAL